MKVFLISVLVLFGAGISMAQSTVMVKGIVKNEQQEVLEGVTVSFGKSVTHTDSTGSYSIKGYDKNISFRLLGYSEKNIPLNPGNKTEIQLNITLNRDSHSLDAVTVTGKNQSDITLRIDPKLLQSFPSVSGNFEAILKMLPGVSSNNELSSQYAVRGGNFDENLIYINDIEIYRPLLVRNGQQEGLSFINPELVSSAGFSAGGFDARYGDKLSSVLDVRYNKPDLTEVILSAGLIGLSGTVKIPHKSGFLLLGARNKTNESILKSQQVKGSYQPEFYDFQGLYQQDVSKKLSFSLFGGYNLAVFKLVPKERETTFGTIDRQMRLHIDFEGQELDKYKSAFGAFTAQYQPSPSLRLKWINSLFSNSEKETFDIEGNYIFDEVQPGLPGAPDVHVNRGIGSSFEHARNHLNADIYSSEVRAYWQQGFSSYEAGIKAQYNRISDQLNEFRLIDSAGYVLPNQDGPLELTDVVSAENSINTNLYTAYLQNTISLSPRFDITAGIRGSYDSYTKEWLLSPRLSARHRINNDFSMRYAAGVYSQPPFYRELRNYNGSLNPQSRAQRSLHFIAESDYSFTGLGTKLTFNSSLYYKKLDRLIPYKVENLRIRYFADQQSKGYAAGADFSLSGEFVENLTSIFRLSLLKTAEDIRNDYYFVKDASGAERKVEPGYLKRPTDQRINFSAFFQDKLLKSPTYKAHLNILYGSALPVGPPQSERWQDKFKIPAYKRVDLGFSKDFTDKNDGGKSRLSAYFDALIVYAEIFNLFNINNTVSYLWIKDVSNNQYAVPDYLTSRQLNLKIVAKIK